MFGYRVDELLGENVSMLMPEPDRNAHDGTWHATSRPAKARIIGIGREVPAQRKDGTRVPVRLSVGRIADRTRHGSSGWCATSSAEQQASRRSKTGARSRARLPRTATMPFCSKSIPSGASRNQRARQRILGAAVPEILRPRLAGFHPWRHRARTCPAMLTSALERHSRASANTTRVDVSGERRRIYWRCIARRAADGSPAGWLCSGADVTDRAAPRTRTWRRKADARGSSRNHG